MEVKDKTLNKRHFIFLIGVLAILIAAGGYLYYRHQANTIREQKYAELAAIAKLKIEQLVQWQKERIADVRVMSCSPFFIHGVEQWLYNKSDIKFKSDLEKRLALPQKEYGYESVFLVSIEGNILLSEGRTLHRFDPVTSEKIMQTVKYDSITFSDFYYCKLENTIHYDINLPLKNEKNVTIAILLLRINPYDYLYPFIQSWPTTSKSSETLLIRKEGDSVLFLNDLRFRTGAALSFKIPLNRTDIPAVQSVLGYEGVFEGKDYRGVDVLSDIRHIPGTAWSMIAKVDQDEIFADLRTQAIIITVFTALLLLACGFGIMWIYHYRQRNIYRLLWRTQEEYRTTLYSIGDAVITTDTSGRVQDMNAVAEQLTGWKEHDAKNKPLEEVFHIINEVTRIRVQDPVQLVLKEGHVVGLANHTLLISKVGKEIPIADSGSPIRNEAGEIVGVVLVFRDQTEERASQKKLQESEEQFRHSFDVSPVGIVLVGLDKRFLRCNTAFSHALGYSSEELIGRAIEEITVPEDRDIGMPEMKSIIKGEIKTSHVEKRYRRKDGQVVWGEVTISLVKDQESHPQYFLAVIQDVTERKEAEEALNRSKQLLEETGAVGKVGGWTFDIDTLVQTWTEETYRIHELDLSFQPTVENGINFYTPASRPIIEQAVKRAIELGEPWNLDLEIITAKGNIRKVNAIGKADMKNHKIYGFFQDITERKQAEKMLEKSEEQYREAQKIAHIGHWTFDPVSHEFTGSPEAMRIYGFPKATVVPFEDIAGCVSKAEVERVTQALFDLVQNGKEFNEEFEICPRNSSEVRVLHSVAQMKKDEHGNPKLVSGILQDITERKQAEVLLNDLIEKNPLSIQVMDKDGLTLKVNLAHTLLFGALPPPDFSIFTDLQNKGFGEYVLLAKKGEVVRFPDICYNVHDIFPDLPDKPVWIRAILFPLISAGIPVRFVFMHEDITERKQAEKQIIVSRERYRQLFDNSGTGVIIVDEDGKYVLVNNIAAASFKIPPEEIIGKSMFDFFPREKADQYLEFNRQLIRTGGRREYEDCFSLPGGERNFLIIDQCLKNENGRNFAIQSSSIDITERKRAEEALCDNELKYRTLFETSVDALLLFTDGRWVDCNAGALRVFGCTREQIIGEHPKKFSPPTQPDGQSSEELAVERINLAFSKEPQAFEWVHCRADGTLFDAEVYLNLLDLGGKPFMQAIVRDVTDRKRAQKELQVSEERFRHSFDYAAAGVCIVGTDSKFQKINNAFREMIGYDEDEIKNLTFNDITHPDDRSIGSDQLKTMLSGKADSASFEKRYISKDKRTIWVHISASLVKDIHNQPQFFVTHAIDITERKLVEEALTKTQTQIRAMMNSTDDMIWSVDPVRFGLLSFNQGLKEYFKNKLNVDCQIGMTPEELLPADFAVQWHEIYKRALREGSFVTEYLTSSGINIWILTVNIMKQENEVFSISVFSKDITERKQMEEGMRQMQKMEGLGTLAGGIAHDFNNILGIILAYISSIKRFKDDTKKLDLAAETITKAVQRGKTLVQQILMFARKTETTFGAVAVNDIVMEVLGMVIETFPKTLTYAQNFDKSIPYINADHSQLHQVLMNLCVNARDAMPTGGVLTINTRMISVVSLRNQHPEAVGSSYVCIEVSDTGEGMTEEIRKRIFEPFFTTKGIGKGTGLGLSVTLGVIQSHKGFIDVESKIGKGTTFRLYLPASQAAVPVIEKDEQTLEEISGGTETLLVVEDEEMLLMSLKMVLEEKGYCVLSAHDGFTALKIYQEKKKEIALVLTDLGLPNMSGLEVCRQIKIMNPREHLVLATGYLDPEMKSESLKTGIEYFLYKPYDLTKVLKVIREVLDKK